MRLDMLEIHIITAGDKDEEKFITYGIGVQVSCCLGTKKHRKIVYGKLQVGYQVCNLIIVLPQALVKHVRLCRVRLAFP